MLSYSSLVPRFRFSWFALFNLHVAEVRDLLRYILRGPPGAQRMYSLVPRWVVHVGFPVASICLLS